VQTADLKFLRISVAGVRGVVGQTLAPELMIDFAAAFGTYLAGGEVLVGVDTRFSGEMIRRAAVSALLACGCDATDLGICPTPVLQWLVRQRKAAGGISISAGHNAAEWNGLNFINADGAYLTPQQGQEVLDIFHSHEFERKGWRGVGKLQQGEDATRKLYLDALCGYLDTKAIRAANLTGIVDPCNGAGAPLLAEFAERLGLRLIPINCEPSGIFPHDPEPRPRNARQIAAIMKPVHAHAGFLFNSDMSRVSVVSNVGETVTEEYSFPLVAAYLLARRSGAVVTNCCSTRTLDDIAKKHGARVIKTPVGPAFIIASLLEEGGLMAGDGSGSVAVAEFSPAMDGFLTMGLILEAMATQQRTLAKLIDELPRYHIVKDKIYCPAAKAYRAVNAVRQHFQRQGLPLDLTDGVRVDWKDAWVHVRASATEPLVRVICEAKTRAKALEIAAGLEKVVQERVQA